MKKGFQSLANTSVLTVVVDELRRGMSYFRTATDDGEGTFLTGSGRGRFGDLAKLAPEGVESISVQCRLDSNPNGDYVKDQPWIVSASEQLLVLVDGDRRLPLDDDRNWIEANKEAITAFLGGAEVQTTKSADKQGGAKPTPTATPAPIPAPQVATPAPKPQRLNVSPEMLKFVERLVAKRDELAVVTVAEEAKIHEAINGLGFQILSDIDRESARALVIQAREAIVAEKRRVAIEALQKEMSIVTDEMELATLEVVIPTITRDGVTYPEEGVHPIATATPQVPGNGTTG